MEQLIDFSQLSPYIDLLYLVTFVLLANVIKKSFQTALDRVTPFTWEPTYTVLIVATILAIPFLLLTPSTWQKILLTYAVGTSFYELILERLFKFFKPKE